ncbi:MAG TPA: hypothetical protein VFK34_08390 [Marmoricola sp.]|nr:hypothetical protein [Marmoricola sp.]
MTIFVERPPATSTFPLDRRASWAAAALFVLGGAFQLAEFLLERSPDAPGARVDWWLAHDGRTQLSQAVGLLAVPLMIGGFLYGYRLIREQSRRLSLVAISLLVIAMVGLGMVHGIEFAARWAAVAGHRAAATDILQASNPGLPGIVGFVMFLGCAVLGNVLVAVALWRSRYVPRVVAVLVIAFAVLDFAAGQGLAAHVLDLGTDGLFAWAFLSGYVRGESTPSTSETGPTGSPAVAH